MDEISYQDPNPCMDLAMEQPQEDSLTWEHFHPPPKHVIKPFHRPDSRDRNHWKHIVNTINDHRIRFAQHTPAGGNSKCCNLDRSAVLAVYHEALSRLEHISKADSCRIFVEARTKVETILDLRTAAPSDPVFSPVDAFLKPLEPHYAQPRLNYYDRERANQDDSYYWTGQARLVAWRDEGWPKVYPVRAVEREKRERRERQKKGRRLLRITAAEGLMTALDRDPKAWGEEVDADPERAWK